MSEQNKQIGFTLGTLAVVALLILFIYTQVSSVIDGGEADMSEAAVAKRIEPVGKLNTGEPIAASAEQAQPAPAAPESQPSETVKTAAGSGRSGQQVYQSHCIACHGTGASGAPKLGDQQAWQSRIAKGMDALMESAVNGVPGTAMLPKGTCNDCSPEELQNAVQYMVEQSS